MTAQPPNNHSNNSSDGQFTDPVSVPPQVFAQLDALRNSGLVNMITEVEFGLQQCGFDEARQWIINNPKAYDRGVRKGFEPTDPDAVDELDVTVPDLSVEDQDVSSPRVDATSIREQRILEFLDGVRDFSPEAAEYYAEGCWRETVSLSEEELDLAAYFDRMVDCQPQHCYRNAQLVATGFAEPYDLAYVEGVVLTESIVSPIQHAWVELNGKVIELTFPDGPEPGSQAVYLGKEFPIETVREQINEMGIVDPLAG